jgi:hypothetical protein
MALSKITAGSIADGTIVAADIADGSITGPKLGATAINANNIVDGTITGAKLGATSINANNIVNASITGDKIGVGQITANLFASGAVSTTSISNGNSNVSIASANSNVSIFTAGTKAAEFDSSANFQFNSGYGSVATAYGCRAWVNFNGTGTVAIREDGNVSSITDNGTGDYTVNFTTAMPDANYAVSALTSDSGVPNRAIALKTTTTPTTSLVRVQASSTSVSDSGVDGEYISVAIFR